MSSHTKEMKHAILRHGEEMDPWQAHNWPNANITDRIHQLGVCKGKKKYFRLKWNIISLNRVGTNILKYLIYIMKTWVTANELCQEKFE